MTPTETRAQLTLSFPTGPFFGPDSWHRSLDVARLAESSGVAMLRLPEHVVMGERIDRYDGGPFPYAVDAPWLDPLVAISAMAAVTKRLRFCTSILIAPIRPAPLLAKMAASIDALSGGRLELGVGTGWQREEFEASGVDFGRRGRLLTDTIGACRALWASGAAFFESETVRLAGVWCEPKPVQSRLPVHFSGSLTPRNLERIVTLGDGWIPRMDADSDDVAASLPLLRRHWNDAGRDPAGLRVHARLPVRRDASGRADLNRTLAGARPLIEIGVTDLQLASVPFMGHQGELERFFGEIDAAWRDFAAL